MFNKTILTTSQVTLSRKDNREVSLMVYLNGWSVNCATKPHANHFEHLNCSLKQDLYETKFKQQVGTENNQAYNPYLMISEFDKHVYL